MGGRVVRPARVCAESRQGAGEIYATTTDPRVAGSEVAKWRYPRSMC